MHRLRTEFRAGCAGRIHVSTFHPHGRQRGAVVVAQPFAEEANKSRRMIAMVGRSLAECGITTYVPDLFGCGDSEGDFEDADWPIWQRDLGAVVESAEAHHGGSVILFGLRVGAILATDALHDRPEVRRVIFWQPVVSGEQALAQFLRLRTAAALMDGRKETVGTLRRRLEAGDTVEVAGYTLSPALAQALARRTLDAPPQCADAWSHWFALSTSASVPKPLENASHVWREAGWSVSVERLDGDAFWATQEIATVPALVERTVNACREALP